ncbi:hypothetical protein [Nostoc sp. JL31]|nr:hypothetical protein [Nostoc sp. JL31]
MKIQHESVPFPAGRYANDFAQGTLLFNRKRSQRQSMILSK